MEPERPVGVRRRVWMVRLAAWGTVLVLAVIAFNLRAGSSTGDYQGANGEQLNGSTAQKQAIWAVMDGDKVRELDITWRFECDNGGEIEPWGGTFRDATDHFEWHGSEFSFEDEGELPRTDEGWVPRVRVEVSGRGEEGHASGESGAVMWWKRGRERGTVCRSGRVSWSVP